MCEVDTPRANKPSKIQSQGQTNTQNKRDQKAHQENDRRYQDLFKNVEMIRDLLIYSIDEPWVNWVDFDGVELVNTKFLTGQLARRDADLVFKLPFKDGQHSYLALFLEFQSSVDRFMALRVSTYQHLFWENCVKLKQLSPNGKLPPVFGIVLYNGERRWRSAQKLRTLVELPKGSPLWSSQPQARYHLIDESHLDRYDASSISHRLFQVEFCKSPSELVALIGEAQDLAKTSPRYEELWRNIARWFRAATFTNLQLELPLGPLLDDIEGVKPMLAETMKGWTEEWMQEGFEQGVEQGLERGLERAVAGFLSLNLSDDAIIRALQITEDQLTEIKYKIAMEPSSTEQ